MHTIDSIFSKLNDDETCAILKPNPGIVPPINQIVAHISDIFKQFPEIKKRVLAKISTEEM
jgi:hypothetical protein